MTTLAGLPAMRLYGGNSPLTTTECGATIECDPIVQLYRNDPGEINEISTSWSSGLGYRIVITNS